ncbi:HNH nuclease [Comamonadaceae bacterium]
MGRIRRLLQQEHARVLPADLVCPLCERKIPTSQRDAHHLVPKSKGGRHTEYLHRICHRQIHALFTETELARQFNSVEALLTHPDVALFVAWVKTKPDDFMERTRKSQRICPK